MSTVPLFSMEIPASTNAGPFKAISTLSLIVVSFAAALVLSKLNIPTSDSMEINRLINTLLSDSVPQSSIG